jgi:hypothetical protein
VTLAWTRMPLQRALRPGGRSSTMIKGEAATETAEGLVPGFSASGQDVWLGTAQYDCPGLVLSAVGARCGKVFEASGRWGVVANTSVLLPQPGHDPHFLWYLVNNEDFWEKGGTAQPYVRVPETLSRRLPFPPLEEQRRIAEFLDIETARIDALISKKRQLMERLGERQKAHLLETMATGSVPETPLRPLALDWLPTVPAHWAVVPLRRLVTSDNAGEVIDKSWWGSGSERLYTCAVDPLASDYPDFPDWKRTNPNDLLVTRNGTPYVHLPEPGSIYSNVVQRIVLAHGVGREFTAMALVAATSAMRGYGVSIESLNFDMWKSLTVVVPPPGEQQQLVVAFRHARERTEAAVDRLARQIELLKEHRQAIVITAVSGGELDPEALA